MKYRIGVVEHGIHGAFLEFFVKTPDGDLIIFDPGEDNEEVRDAIKEVLGIVELAEKLALALADEMTFHGEQNCSEASLKVLAQARDLLNLQDEFEKIDTLSAGWRDG